MFPGDTSTKRVFVKPGDLGVSPGTIWKTRPYSFIGEGPTDNYFKTVNTQYVVVFDSDEGYVRPAVKWNGRIVDASVSFGSFVYHGSGPQFAGDTTLFYKGDEWEEVDASGEPIDTEALTSSRIRELQRQGLLAPIEPPTELSKVARQALLASVKAVWSAGKAPNQSRPPTTFPRATELPKGAVAIPSSGGK